MPSFNRVILLGNVTRPIELKHLQSGTAVCEVGLAINDKRKDNQGNWVEDVTFVDVTLWGRTAEVAAEYLNKGSPVLIEGRLKLETWEKDGQKRSKLKVVGERLQLLGGKKDGAPSPRQDSGYDRRAPSASSERTPAYDDAPPANTGGDYAEDNLPF